MAFRTVFCSLIFLALQFQLHAAMPDGFVIHVSEDNHIGVRPYLGSRLEIGKDKQGLVVWKDGNRDRWEFFSTSWEHPSDAPVSARDSAEVDLPPLSRGSSSLASHSPELLQPTTELPQLRSPVVTRGVGSLLTPYEGALSLTGQLTLRRAGSVNRDGTTEKLPPAVAVLRRGNNELLKIAFGENITKLSWNEIEGLPEELRAGLPPGTYQLKLPTPTGPENVSFSICEPLVSERLLLQQKKLAKLLSPAHPLAIQVAAETLLAHSPPLLTDAANMLEPLDPQKCTTRLADLRKHVMQRLTDPGQEASPAVGGDATGDGGIDSIRALIASCQWESALEEITEIEASDLPNDARQRGLAYLYHAVVLGEAGQVTEQDVLSKFIDSLTILEKSSHNPADLYRVHNSIGNYFLERSIDLRHGQAFRAASGEPHPLASALATWHRAHDHYSKALNLAGTDTQRSSVELNLAHLHIVLGEFVDTLATRASPTEVGKLKEGATQAAMAYATAAANRLNVAGANRDSMLIAVSSQLLGHLAFNSLRYEEALEHATSALRAYEDSGSIVGAESCHRLLGMIATSSPSKSSETTLKHLMVSDQLSEILRLQMPDDHVGAIRSAFLARRVYVTELIIKYLVEAGRAKEALVYAEVAKARSLYDTFANSSLGVGSTSNWAHSAAELTDQWPADLGAMAYFSGTESVWAFAILPGGDVFGKKLCRIDGQDVNASELTSEIKKFLDYIDLFGPKTQPDALMALKTETPLRLSSNEWQHTLHHFYEVLWPSDIRMRMRSAKFVVISPHKLLHYIPYPALVTEIDDIGTTETGVARPKYLVDEPFCVVQTPSLFTWRQLQTQEQPEFERVNIVGIVDFRERAPALPGIAREVAAIKQVFGSQVSTVLGDDAADEGAILRLLGESGLLVLSTHGMKNAMQPLQSYLLCRADGVNDGKLTAAEIFDTSVKSDIVFLNACYSGYADRTPLESDDLFGLQRALLSSGARTVVSGIWDVSDASTPEITRVMMGQLAKRVPIAEAMAIAQRTHLRKWRTSEPDAMRLLSHPYYWACLNVAGDHRTTCRRMTGTDKQLNADGVAEDSGRGTDEMSLLTIALRAIEAKDTKTLAKVAMKSLSAGDTVQEIAVAEQVWIVAILVAIREMDHESLTLLLHKEMP